MLSTLEKRHPLGFITKHACKQKIKLIIDKTSNLPCHLSFMCIVLIYGSCILQAQAVMWCAVHAVYMSTLNLTLSFTPTMTKAKLLNAPIKNLCSPVLLEILSYSSSADVAMMSATSRFFYNLVISHPQRLAPPTPRKGNILTLEGL